MLDRREINPPGVSKELLSQLLFAESEEQFQGLLAAHPELQRFDEIGLPMHQALQMLEMTEEFSDGTHEGERILMVSEVQPGISSVTTETSAGKRIANLYEIPPDTLSTLILVTPADLQIVIPKTLQVSLHYPEYLTEESYWLMAEIISYPKISLERKQRMIPLHKALGICLEYGLNQEWILKLRQSHNKSA